MKPVRKAVLPVAGLVTRFLPATNAMPKEMLPVVDRPLIQHVVDEARDAGIEHFIFVTGRNKGVIEDHFDRQFELEHTLTGRQRPADLDALAHDLPGPGSASFTRQQLPLGPGHAVWCARELVDHGPFALLLPDVLVQHNRGCLGQMIDAANSLGENANIVAFEPMELDHIHMYGVVGVGEHVDSHGGKLTDHPHNARAAARMGTVEPDPHQPLHPAAGDLRDSRRRKARRGGEIQLTDAMIELANRQPFYGLEFEGRAFDCGSWLPRRQRRLCARASRHRPCLSCRDQAAVWLTELAREGARRMLAQVLMATSATLRHSRP
jgi:UTP--glucose-1-phosphate uridylyltransferase